MYGPGFGIVQNEDVEHEGQGRSIPELKEGPDEWYVKEHIFRNRPGWVPGAGLCFCNHFPHFFVRFCGFCWIGHCHNSFSLRIKDMSLKIRQRDSGRENAGGD